MKLIITEMIGFIAYMTLAFSYFKKEKKNILLMQIIAITLFAIHFYLLNGLTGTICNILELIMLIVIYIFDKFKWKNKKLLIIGVIPVCTAISLITYKDIFSFFPIIACVTTIASFLTSKEEIIRGIGIVSAVCWLVYAVGVHSIVSTVCEIITLISVLIAFVKNERKKKE